MTYSGLCYYASGGDFGGNVAGNAGSSRRLLESAKRAVAIAIEQDEVTAITWLEAHRAGNCTEAQSGYVRG